MKDLKTDVLYCAPGAGVGHLVRACAVARRVGALGLSCRIATNSTYSEGIARIVQCKVTLIDSSHWKSQARELASACGACVVVLDSFPFGIRGEWMGEAPPGVEFVYIARRLNLSNYLDAAVSDGTESCPRIDSVIVAEPLGADHEAFISELNPRRILTLPGRIRLDLDFELPPEPKELAGMLAGGKTWMVVHSGPESEMKVLVERARKDIEERGGGELAVVSPLEHAATGVRWFEYFPASVFYGRAVCVVTAGGYNSVAETNLAKRRIAVPFERRFDDQAARTTSGFDSKENGAQAAAEFIASMIVSQARNL